MKSIIILLLSLFFISVSCGPRNCKDYEGIYINQKQKISIEMTEGRYIVMADADMNGNMVELDKGRYELSSSCEFIPVADQAYFVKIEIEDNELKMLRRDGAALKFMKKQK